MTEYIPHSIIFTNLPSEITTTNILSRLPIRSTALSKCGLQTMFQSARLRRFRIQNPTRPRFGIRDVQEDKITGGPRRGRSPPPGCSESLNLSLNRAENSISAPSVEGRNILCFR